MITKPQPENCTFFTIKYLKAFPQIYLRFLGLVFLLFICLIVKGNRASVGKIVYKVAIDKEFEPYEFLNQDNQAAGFVPSILREIGNRANVTFEFYPMTWSESVNALRIGQVDLIDMIYSDQRAAMYEFSEPYCEITQALFNTDQTSGIVDLSSLGGHNVGFQKDDISLSFIDTDLNIKRYLFDSKLDGLLHLNIGKIDAFICAEQAGINIISKYQFKNINLASGGLFAQKYAFATLKGNTHLISLLNIHLLELQDSGRIYALKEKWLSGKPQMQGWLAKNESILVSISILFLGIVILMFLWNSTLQRLVDAKTKILKESEEKYRTIFENLQDVFYQIDLKGIILDVSPSIKRFSSYEREEVIGLQVFDLYVNPEDRKIFIETILKQGELRDYELRFKTKTGEIFVSTNAQIILGADGNPDHINGALRDITERKRFEAELEESREKYRGLSEAAFESIFFSEKGICIEQNDNGERIFGYTTEEALGRYGTEWIVAEDREMVMKNMLSGYEEPYEARALKKDGTTFPCLLRGRMMRYKGRNVRVTSLTDISSIKKVEEELRESKEKYQKDLIFLKSIFESPIDIIIFALDKNYCYTAFTQFHSKTIKKIWGVDIRIGMNMLELISSAEDRQKAKKNFDRALNGEYFTEIEDYGDVKLHRTSYENYYSSIKNGSGDIVGLSVFVVDVTHRKLAEKRLELLSRAIDQSPVSVMITDKAGKIEYVNPKFTEVSGYTPEDVNGKTPAILQSGYNSKDFYADLWRVILTGNDWRGIFYNQRKNGDIYCESAVISSILDSHGNISNFVAVKEDITEKRKILEDLTKAEEHAEESDKLKTAFLNNISHEIRTPFNGILGFLEILQNTDLSIIERDEYTGLVSTCSTRLMNTINKIIEIAQIQSGQMELSASKTDIKSLIISCLEQFQTDIQRKGLKFSVEIDLPEHLKSVNTDSIKLTSILTNLIDNAIKFTNKGSVELGIRMIGQNIEFSVNDTGIGIPKSRQQAIFERFSQGDNSSTRQFEGSGLGVTIAKAYVEGMGGTIGVESEEGIGSRFYFTIPV